MKKKKQKTLRQLKEKCWKVFSEWIRRSDADEDGCVRCISCNERMQWKDSHAGHFVPGRTNAVLYCEEAVFPQCPVCNIFKHGNYTDYTRVMIDRYGRRKVDELLALRYQTVKFTRSDLLEKIEVYKAKLESL